VANHKSAVKRHRQSENRRIRNRDVRGRMRTSVKNFRLALASGDAGVAAQRFRDAERELRRAASKGVIPKQRASRHVSRLARGQHALQSS